MISQQLLTELKDILEQDYNLKLTMQEVLEIATALLGYVETLMKIESKANLTTEGGESR
jgi:hypothetical protein